MADYQLEVTAQDSGEEQTWRVTVSSDNSGEILVMEGLRLMEAMNEAGAAIGREESLIARLGGEDD